MTIVTAEVLKLDDYRPSPNSDSTNVDFESITSVRKTEDFSDVRHSIPGAVIPSSRLYGEDAIAATSSNSSPSLQLLANLTAIGNLLGQAHDEVTADQIAVADTIYMQAKSEIRALIGLINKLNDGVATVVWELIRTCDKDSFVVEPKDRVYIIKEVVAELIEYPNMSYDHALRVSSRLEHLNQSMPTPGFEAIQGLIFEYANRDE